MFDGKLRNFGYAFTGLTIAIQGEWNFRIQIALGILALTLGVFFDIHTFEWLFIFGAIGLVLSAELMNTALEELCDMLKPTHDPHVAKIKDLAAAAVFIASLAALSIGVIIFLPKIFSP